MYALDPLPSQATLTSLKLMTGGFGRHRAFIDLANVVLPQDDAVLGDAATPAVSSFRETVMRLQKKTREKVSDPQLIILSYSLLFFKMRSRANNNAEKHLTVGCRVFLKNTTRDAKVDHRWLVPGRITAVHSGSFTIALEDGGIRHPLSSFQLIIAPSFRDKKSRRPVAPANS
jgi:hypothetical protein